MVSQHLLIPRPSLLEHSFYRRWVVGELTLDELGDYAGQYAHVVAALPRWLRSATKGSPGHAETLASHAAEEDRHVELWSRFATAVGMTRDQLALTGPNAATAELLRDGDRLSTARSGAAVAWALEVQTPEVSVEKLRGLKAHYRIERRNGAAYFELHSTRDLAHASELDGVIAGFGGADREEAQRTADVITGGLWNLLTSVEHAA